MWRGDSCALHEQVSPRLGKDLAGKDAVDVVRTPRNVQAQSSINDGFEERWIGDDRCSVIQWRKFFDNPQNLGNVVSRVDGGDFVAFQG